MKGDDEFLFVLNHRAEAAKVDLGELAGTDLFTGRELSGRRNCPGAMYGLSAADD